MINVRSIIGLLLIAGAASVVAETDIDVEVGVELGYDDNVIVEELDIQSSVGDQFIRYRIKADIEHNIDDKHEISASIGINDRQFQDADNFDLRTILATAGYNFDMGDLALGVDIRTADSELGGVDFLKLDQLSPYFSYFISREHFIRGAYTAIDKSLDNSPSRDSDADEFSLDYYYFLNGLNQYFIISGKWRDQDAVDNVFDFTSSQYRLAFNQRIQVSSQELKLSLSYRFRERDYDVAINPQIGEFRLDEKHSLELNASMELIDDLEVFAEVRYLDNDSNLPSFNYTENLYTVGISYEF